ncbi:MAG: hypothetical protein LUI13_02340 [Lachnospiraceae bacterium]|nr:hypothetical protein [Lachnospiraceae bacterium]
MIICEFKEKTVKRETRFYAYSDALMKIQQEHMNLEKEGKSENSKEAARQTFGPEKSEGQGDHPIGRETSGDTIRKSIHSDRSAEGEEDYE